MKTSFIKRLTKENHAVKIKQICCCFWLHRQDFNCFLSATSERICIIYSASAVGAPIGIVGASFTLIFSLTTGIVKKTTKHNKKQKEKA